jgi:ubiquinone/menaquinone biosynthesis C-methylase UbiE
MTSNKQPKALSKARFGQFAQDYVDSQSHAKGYDLERLLEIAQPQADWMALDIATGGGHTALKFAPHVSKVIATDITPKMLQAARAFITGQGITNVDFEPADAEDLPFEDGRFDLVTCRIAPHHFPDCAAFIREAARALKAGGLLLVQDHLLPGDAGAARYIDSFERLRDPSHNRAFDHDQWVGMFTSAGLDVMYTEEIIKRHDLIPWAGRQGCTPETLAQLTQMLRDAPPIAAAWLGAQNVGTHQASFVNHHIIIGGQKPSKIR